MNIKPHYFQVFKNQNIAHGFSNRVGGFSSGSYESLNLGLSTNDKKSHIEKNRDKFFSFHNIESSKLVLPQQIHSDNISIVTKPGIIKATDALITKTPGIVLTVQTADCFPVFLFDFQKRICAIVHSGWRGTAKNIVGKTINLLKVHFRSVPGNIFAGIGAGIQQRNYQVDNTTAKYFDNKYLENDGSEHFKLDLQSKIIDQLIKQGVPFEHVEVDGACTFENSDRYFSYRRDGDNSGRMLGFICLL